MPKRNVSLPRQWRVHQSKCFLVKCIISVIGYKYLTIVPKNHLNDSKRVWRVVKSLLVSNATYEKTYQNVSSINNTGGNSFSQTRSAPLKVRIPSRNICIISNSNGIFFWDWVKVSFGMLVVCMITCYRIGTNALWDLFLYKRIARVGFFLKNIARRVLYWWFEV